VVSSRTQRRSLRANVGGPRSNLMISSPLSLELDEVMFRHAPRLDQGHHEAIGMESIHHTALRDRTTNVGMALPAPRRHDAVRMRMRSLRALLIVS